MRKPLLSGRSLVLLGTAVSMLGGIAVAKVTAVRFGPDGIALAGSLMGLAALSASLALAGQTNALPRWVAEQSDSVPKRHLLRASSVAALVLLVPIAIGIGLIGAWLLRDQWPPALTVLAILVMSYANTVILQRPVFISAISSTTQVVVYGIVATIVRTVVTVVLLLIFPGSWLAASLALGTLAGASVGHIQVRRLCGPPGSVQAGFEMAKSLLVFTRAAFVGTASNAVVMGLIPTVTVVTIGAYEAGLFRASWSVAAIVFSSALSVIRYTYLPQLTQVSLSGGSSQEVGRGTIPQVMVVGALAAVALSLAGPLILGIMYSPEFVTAAPVLSLIGAGSVARVWTSISGLALIAHNHQREYSTIHLVFVLLLMTATVAGGLSGSLLVLGGLVTSAMFVGAVIAGIITRRTLASKDWPGRSLRPLEKLAIGVLVVLCLLPPLITGTYAMA